VWAGTHHWQDLVAQGSERFEWEPRSTYLRRPQYTVDLRPMPDDRLDFSGAKALAVFGDNITTDHISPVGTIPTESVAGAWLLERGESPRDLNQYSTRRSNHEVMLRGAFTTPNLRNLLAGDAHPSGKGAYAWTLDRGQLLPIYAAAQTFAAASTPLIIFAGVNYGTGSSRDWAAKAPALLGVRAVVAQTFERIHRSNLIGMGVSPLQFADGDSAANYGLTGEESIDVRGLDGMVVGNNAVTLSITRADGTRRPLIANLRVDSGQELLYLKNRGVVPYVVRKTVAASIASTASIP
jgi:aconitate hydratase